MTIDIEVGEETAKAESRERPAPADMIEGRVLELRSARRTSVLDRKGLEDKRQNGAVPDPLTARILTLLVPEGLRLPADLDRGNYRVFLQIVRK